MEEELQQRKVNKRVKKILRIFKQYKLTTNIDEAILLLLFYKDDIEKSTIILMDDDVKRTAKDGLEEIYIPFFLEPKNKRNIRNHALSNVERGSFTTIK